MSPPSGEITIAIEWFLLALSVFFVCLRMYSFYRRGTSSLLPELILISAVVVETGCVICDTITYHLGGMLAEELIDVKVTIPLNKLIFASDMLFFLGIFLPKACILALYYDIVPPTSRRLRIALICLTVYVAACWILIFLTMFVSCRPIQTNWSTGSDFCGFTSAKTFFEIHSALDLSCDIMIFILPFFLVYRLKQHKRQRNIVYATFLLGAITISIGISRCISVNISPLNTPIYIWAAAEYCGSMIVVCLPSLRPVAKSIGHCMIRSAGGNHSKPSWVYDKYDTNEGSSKNVAIRPFPDPSPDGSQVELRQLQEGSLKISPPVTI